MVAPHTDDLTARTRAMVERIREISPDIILCHGVGDRIDFNAIRYLPESIPKIPHSPRQYDVYLSLFPCRP